MNAIVCDKCGKTILVEDFVAPEGIARMDLFGIERKRIDLCETCLDELITAVRGTEGNDEP